MDVKTSKIATSKAGLAVLGLLTVAIVAGQADANLPAAASAAAPVEQSGKTQIIFNVQATDADSFWCCECNQHPVYPLFCGWQQ